MNGLFKKYWYLLVLLFVLPIGLNFLLQANAPYSVIGDPSVWLSFWGTYFASILASLITLFVLYKTLKQNETSLLKTLSQNEANNEESKKLQIVIFKKGLEERRIIELSTMLKDYISYVDYPKLTRNCIDLRNNNFVKVKSFFDSEIARCLSTTAALPLDFITTQEDNNEFEFKEIFRHILNEYVNVISMAVRIISIIEYELHKDKLEAFLLRYEEDKKGRVFFSEQELNDIVKTKNAEEFNKIITGSFDIRIKRFGQVYGAEHHKLVSKAKELITYKREHLEKTFID